MKKTESQKGVKKLKKDLWTVFSQYIRLRDKGVCFTCGKKIPDYYDRNGNLRPGWKAGQAGHFITAKTCGLALYFDEFNVHCQCYHCNINLSGNWVEYEKAIIRKYGKEKCEELKRMKDESPVKWKPEYFKDNIMYYKLLIKSLE